MTGALGSFGQSGAPGFLPSSVTGAATQAGASSEAAMANRYAQLGLGSTGATPTTPGGGLAQSTPALMDYGLLPSYTGGIANQQQAVLGQLQNQSLNSPLGKNTSPASILGAIGRII